MFTLDRFLGLRISRFSTYLLATIAIAASLSSPAAMSRQTTACPGLRINSVCYSGTPAASSKPISGRASWDQSMVRAFFKAEMNIDIPDVPTAIPNPEMLDDVNPEFARRVKVLMAVYQASRPLLKVGIVPGDGGLRTADQQLNIFKKGRHDPAGPNGNTPIPQWVPDTPYPHGRCTIAAGRTTCVLASWHNFGLAVDFGQWGLCGKWRKGSVTLIKLSIGCYNNGSQFFGTTAWIKMNEAMRNLGMLSGADFDDKAHVEWHPYLVGYSEAGKLGTAYKSPKAGWPGYDWIIPSQIYTYTDSDHSPAKDLFVVELVACDNQKWICLKEVRYTQFEDENNWQGHRTTFEPAVKAFPAYTPVQTGEFGVYRNYNKAIHGTTTVVDKWYSKSGSGGKRSDEVWDLWTVPQADYAPDFEVTDEQAGADLLISHARRAGSQSAEYAAVVAQNANLRDHSIYTVELRGFERLSQNGRSTHKQWHRHNDDGSVQITTDDNAIAPGHVSVPGVWFGWNRDDGTVGQHNFNLSLPKNAVYQLWASVLDASGHTTITVSGSIPNKAHDKPNYPMPPPKPPPSPKPRPTSTAPWFFQP